MNPSRRGFILGAGVALAAVAGIVTPTSLNSTTDLMIEVVYLNERGERAQHLVSARAMQRWLTMGDEPVGEFLRVHGRPHISGNPA